MHEKTPPQLRGHLVTLRPFQKLTEFDFYWSLVSHPETRRYLGFAPHTILEELHFLDARTAAANAMVMTVNNCADGEPKPVGTISLDNIDIVNGRAELSRIIIVPECRGKGYARDACATLCQYAFSASLKLRLIYACVLDPNQAGRGQLESVGFNCRATLPEWDRVGSLYVDEHVLILRRDDFDASRLFNPQKQKNRTA